MSGLTGLYGGPRVVLLPSFALTQADVEAKVSSDSLKLADDATLVLEGPHIRIESLSRNRGLTIVNARDDATLVVRDADVANAGVAFTDIADADLPSSKPFEKMRGYKAVDEGSLKRGGAGPGRWVLTGAGPPGEGRGQGGALGATHRSCTQIYRATGTQGTSLGRSLAQEGAGPSPFSGSERPKPGPMLAGGVADTPGARPFER